MKPFSSTRNPLPDRLHYLSLQTARTLAGARYACGHDGRHSSFRDEVCNSLGKRCYTSSGSSLHYKSTEQLSPTTARLRYESALPHPCDLPGGSEPAHGLRSAERISPLYRQEIDLWTIVCGACHAYTGIRAELSGCMVSEKPSPRGDVI